MHHLIPIPMSFMAFMLMAGAYANREARTPAPPARTAAAQAVRHAPAPLPKRETAPPTTTTAE